MASISTDSKGLRRILFVGADGQRRPIRLGRVPIKTARTIKAHVENLAAAALGHHAPDAETSAWIGGLDSVLHAKLAAVGLVPQREPQPNEARPEGATLAGFIKQYIAARPGMKPNTLKNYRRRSGPLWNTSARIGC